MLKKIMIGLITTVAAGGLGLAGYGLYHSGVQDASSGAQTRQLNQAGGGYGRAGEQASGGQRQGGQGQGSGPIGGQGSGAAGERGQGGRGGNAPTDRPQAGVEGVEWLTVEGVIASVDSGLLIVETDDGELIEIALGPEHYWTAQGVSLNVGAALSVRYFAEDGENKAGAITLVDSGETLLLRDETGRPLWSGSASRDAGGTSVGRGSGDEGSGAGYRGGRDG